MSLSTACSVERTSGIEIDGSEVVRNTMNGFTGGFCR